MLKGEELSGIKKGAKVLKKEGDVLYLKNGNYNQKTGIATIKKMKLPFVLDKMEKLHKANTNSPLYFLNIFLSVFSSQTN